MSKAKLRIKQFYILLKYLIFKLFSFVYKEKYKNIWLISERGDEARDNGYAFFQYMLEKHPEIDVRYVITKNSPDFYKIKDKSKLVLYQSALHFKIFISAKYLISSHIMGFSPEFRSFGKLDKKINFFCVKGKKIFLQHGITKDYIDALTNKCVNLDLFVCGAHPEYNYILNNFGYNENIVKYTGFARYDNLKNEESDFILFMPTWRADLFYCSNLEEFTKTDYYKKINSILNDSKLNKALEKNGKKIIFYPHYEVQKYISAFSPSANVIIASKKEYDVPALLRQCKMLITDYSSVYFDIAYLKKPIIYYQFDYENYRKNQYQEGYFNYSKDGFGPVVIKHEDCVKQTINYLLNGFKIEKEYLINTQKFFKYNDIKNCERIYEEIIKL